MRMLSAALIWLALGAAASAQPASPLYRVFLHDGTAIASFGEWVRVDEHLIFSMPLTRDPSADDLRLVSLPVGRVDVARTERYADAVRASVYASTRGEADFAQLSTTVAYALNQVALLDDPKQRLATAEQARRSLAEWPGRHHGYRAPEVAEILGVLDEIISGLRASAGASGFELALAASTVAPPPEPLLPAPSEAELVQHVVLVSGMVDSAAEKVSLLESLVAFLDRAIDYLPSAVASAIRGAALRDIGDEKRIDTAYAALRTSVVAEASTYAARADVRGLERLRQRVRAEDLKLGERRRDVMSAVTATLDAHLESAHRLRLAHDQWLLGEPAMRAYRTAAQPHLQALEANRASLDDIKLLAGPAPVRLHPLSRQLENNARLLALIEPPPQLVAVHALFRSVYALAIRAVQLRREAVGTADLDVARQAAAAASGALLLLDRARGELRAAMQPPLGLAPRQP